MITEVADNALGIGAGAGSEDGDAFHERIGFQHKSRKVSRVCNPG